MSTSIPPEHPFGSVAHFVERFRSQTTKSGLLNMLVGAVEGAVQFSVDDATAVAYVRHALAAEQIVSGELESARALAVAERHEIAERHEAPCARLLPPTPDRVRAYPVPERSADDPRFNRALVVDVGATLESAGYPPVRSTPDKIRLASALLNYIYDCAGEVGRSGATLPRIIGQRGRNVGPSSW